LEGGKRNFRQRAEQKSDQQREWKNKTRNKLKKFLAIRRRPKLIKKKPEECEERQSLL
jgi:hypothetical protein